MLPHVDGANHRARRSKRRKELDKDATKEARLRAFGFFITVRRGDVQPQLT
jgi:hypothetical protein